MFTLSSAASLHGVDGSAPEPVTCNDPRADQLALQLALANATLICLERYAERATVSLRHELTPRLARLRTIEAHCTEWLSNPQALVSPTVPKAATLLHDEADALDALSESLTPQAFAHHLQQREALADRARTAMSVLSRSERTGEAGRAYFDALMRLDTTDDVRQLPHALADLQASLDALCAFVACRREAHRRQTAARAALRPSEQCAGTARIVVDRRRRRPDIASSTPLSTVMPPPREVPKRPRLDGPGMPATQVATSGGMRPPSMPDFNALLEDSL